MENEPVGIQIGIVDDTLPNQTFEICRMRNGTTLVAVSPFRLGELPNVRLGVASVTGADEAVDLYQKLAEQMWQRASKGANGRGTPATVSQRASNLAPKVRRSRKQFRLDRRRRMRGDLDCPKQSHPAWMKLRSVALHHRILPTTGLSVRVAGPKLPSRQAPGLGAVVEPCTRLKFDRL